jgi:hypothetical protein
VEDQTFILFMKALDQHFADDKRAQDAHLLLISQIDSKLESLMEAHWMRKGSGIIISGLISFIVSILVIVMSNKL